MADETEIFLKIIVNSKQHSIADISSLLGVEPSFSMALGEIKKNGRVCDTNFWTFSSQGHVMTTVLDEHWNWIYSKLEPNEGTINFLQTTDAMLDVCGYHYDRPELTFSNTALSQISVLGFSVGWDVYDFSE